MKLLPVVALFLLIIRPNAMASYHPISSGLPHAKDVIDKIDVRIKLANICPIISGTPDWLITDIHLQTSNCREIYLLTAIAKYESTFNVSARNSRSTATGLYQYLNSTWLHHNCGHLGLRLDSSASIACALKDLRRGLGKQWAVWPKVNINPHGYRI